MKYSLYKTGRICVYDKLRIKQGLQPQTISNLSIDCMNCNNCCNDNCLYPFSSVKLNYCCRLPNKCNTCTRYIQPI